MATWTGVSLTVIGEKKAVSAFDRGALQLPVLSEYVTERDGKPITWAIFEDMIVEKPSRWCRYWWCSGYHFMTKDPQPTIEMVQDVSSNHLNLCFQLDWDCEHEEFRTHFVRRGRLESKAFDAKRRRHKLFEELTDGSDGDDAVDWEINAIVSREFSETCRRLWHSRIYGILYSQRRRSRYW